MVSWVNPTYAHLILTTFLLFPLPISILLTESMLIGDPYFIRWDKIQSRTMKPLMLISIICRLTYGTNHDVRHSQMTTNVGPEHGRFHLPAPHGNGDDMTGWESHTCPSDHDRAADRHFEYPFSDLPEFAINSPFLEMSSFSFDNLFIDPEEDLIQCFGA